jgi:hypothetical protein
MFSIICVMQFVLVLTDNISCMQGLTENTTWKRKKIVHCYYDSLLVTILFLTFVIQECLTDECTGLSSLSPTQRPEACCGNREFHGGRMETMDTCG